MYWKDKKIVNGVLSILVNEPLEGLAVSFYITNRYAHINVYRGSHEMFSVWIDKGDDFCVIEEWYDAGKTVIYDGPTKEEVIIEKIEEFLRR